MNRRQLIGISIIFMMTPLVFQVTGTTIPQHPSDYDSGWKERNLDYRKFRINLNCTELNNVSSHCFIWWRVVNDNGTYIWEEQTINETEIEVDQNLWYWRLIIWCDSNFTVSIQFELGSFRTNFVLPELGVTTDTKPSGVEFVFQPGNITLGVIIGLVLGFYGAYIFFTKRSK